MRMKGLLAVGAAIAGLEAYNRAAIIPRAELEPQLPVTPTTWQWRFGDVAVYEAGEASAPPLLLLHGHNAAASAAEMREPFGRFAHRFHDYAADLPGCGLAQM